MERGCRSAASKTSAFPSATWERGNELGFWATVRETFKHFLMPTVPDNEAASYTMLDPVHVRITGSIFFDVDHAAGVVGPGNFKPKTAWEIHPITKLEFLNN